MGVCSCERQKERIKIKERKNNKEKIKEGKQKEKERMKIIEKKKIKEIRIFGWKQRHQKTLNFKGKETKEKEWNKKET